MKNYLCIKNKSETNKCNKQIQLFKVYRELILEAPRLLGLKVRIIMFLVFVGWGVGGKGLCVGGERYSIRNTILYVYIVI